MKLTALLLISALPAAAQTAAPAKSPAAKPVVHHAAGSTAAKTTAARTGCYADLPALGAALPKAVGCPKVLYAERYLDLVVGTGALAEPRKFYTVDYTGYFTDGTVFDSSKGKQPITFPQGAGRVIPGFDTAFENMHIGGKRRVFIPYEIAYGAAGVPKQPNRPGNGIPPKSLLIFDLELVSVSDTPPAPPKPPTPPTAPAPPAASTPAKPATPATPASAPATPPTPPSTSSPSAPQTAPPATPPIADPTKPTAAPQTPPKP